jgi:hypothetical protein
MSARRRAVLLAVAASVMAAFGVAGHSRLSGPVLWRFGHTTHGVHLDDLVVVACWVVSLVEAWWLWTERGPSTRGGQDDATGAGAREERPSHRE